jgi:hypothetical protein
MNLNLKLILPSKRNMGEGARGCFTMGEGARGCFTMGEGPGGASQGLTVYEAVERLLA